MDCADFALSSATPRSKADGRDVSSDGREEAGDLGIVSVDVCDLDLTASRDGRGGSVWSGRREEGLGCAFSNVRGWLMVRL